MGRKTNGRVKISTNVPVKLTLAGKVYSKHLEDGPGSILSNLDGIQWSEAGPLIESCMKDHIDAENTIMEGERIYRERDLKLEAIEEALRLSKLTLKGRFVKNPKQLSNWGFEVDDSPPPKKEKKPE